MDDHQLFHASNKFPREDVTSPQSQHQHTQMLLDKSLSDISTDTADDPTYREKFENLKIIISRQSRELQSEKLRNKSVQSIAICLEQEQQQNRLHREEIHRLQSDKVQLESKCARLENCIKDVDNNVPERQLQRSEILTNDTSLIAEKMGDFVQQIEALKHESNQYQMQIQRLNAENFQLKSASPSRASPSSPSSASFAHGNISPQAATEISHLQSHIQQLEMCKDSQSELCKSLTEEGQVLKQKLNDTALMCQQLAQQLEEKEPGSAQGVARAVVLAATKIDKLTLTGTSISSSSLSGTTDSKLLESQNHNLKQQVERLSNELKELLEMNTRWQLYNDQREEYVQKLNKTLTDTEDKLARGQGVQLSEHQQQEIDRIILQHKRKVEMAEEAKGQIEDENRALRMKVDQLQRQLQDSEGTINALTERLQAIEGTLKTPNISAEAEEMIKILKHQIQCCTEDFESERKDRERAQAQVETLTRELQNTKQQLDQHGERAMGDIFNRRQRSMDSYQQEYERNHPHGTNLVHHGISEYQCDGPKEGEEGMDEIDGRFLAASKPHPPAAAPKQHEQTLQCPKCKTEYPVSKHKDLLEHIDVCCE